MKIKEIKKYCEICNKLLILKNQRDIERKKCCSRKCLGFYTIKHRTKEENEKNIKKMHEKCNTKESNLKKGIHPNYISTSKLHGCLICNKEFLVSLHRHNKGYGKWCSKQCYRKHQLNNYETINCLECNKEVYSPKKKNRKFCSVSCRAAFNIKKHTFGTSKIEKEFLDYMKITNRNVSIQNFVVDGLCGNVIYEFLGDYYHGNPDVFKNQHEINIKTNKSFVELYNYTFTRFKQLKEVGYEIKYIWEKDWKDFNQNKVKQPRIQTYL